MVAGHVALACVPRCNVVLLPWLQHILDRLEKDGSEAVMHHGNGNGYESYSSRNTESSDHATDGVLLGGEPAVRCTRADGFGAPPPALFDVHPVDLQTRLRQRRAGPVRVSRDGRQPRPGSPLGQSRSPPSTGHSDGWASHPAVQ